MSWLTIFLWFTLIIILLICWSQKRDELYRKFKVLPILQLPILGHISIAFSPRQEILKLFYEHGMDTPIRLKLFTENIITISDSVNLQAIINEPQYNKGIFSRFAKFIFGDGLITTDNLELWKLHRRSLSPLFNMNREISSFFFSTLSRIIGEHINELDSFANTGKSINIWRFISHCEYLKVSGTLMEYECNDEKRVRLLNEYQKFIGLSNLFTIDRVYKPYLHNNNIFKLFNKFKRREHIYLGVRKLPKIIIAEKLNRNSETITHKLSNNTGPSLIDCLLKKEIRINYTDAQLVDEVITFLDAGSVTVPTAVCFTLLMLAIHQIDQEKVYNELMKTFEGKKFAEKVEQINELSFLEQCIKEAMRLFPPVPQIVRSFERDITLPSGLVIPAYTNIFLSIFLLHRNPNIYTNPDKWNPNRFIIPEVGQTQQSVYTYCPFGAGPRKCIAYKYAFLSMKLQIAAILIKFRLKTEMQLSDIKLDFDIALRNRTGHNIILETRM